MQVEPNKFPDFRHAKQVNQAYHEVYGVEKNPRHPVHETAGDKAVAQRMNFGGPMFVRSWNNPGPRSVMGAMQKVAGDAGYSKMTKLKGMDNFTTRRRDMSELGLDVYRSSQLDPTTMSDLSGNVAGFTFIGLLGLMILLV